MTRKEAITRIRAALRARSEWKWSVRGGTGTAYGWIDVIAPPLRCYQEWCMMAEDREELAKLFHLDRPVHHQGLSISPEEREHYVSAAETP